MIALLTFAAAIEACSALIGIEDRPLGDLRAADATTELVVTSGDAGAVFDAPQLGPTGCEAAPGAAPVLEERCGVFVASSGADANLGTRAAPLATIAAGMRAAIDRKLYRVFVCTGAYPERVAMGSEGVSLVGGLVCSGSVWTSGGEASIVRPPEGIALVVSGAMNAVVLDSMRFESKTATQPGESSIAALVTNAASVTFLHSRIAAGAGAAGVDGAPGALGVGGGVDGKQAGTGGSALTGAGATACDCIIADAGVGTTTGGAGGTYQGVASAGLPAIGDGGAAGTNGSPCTAGGNGSDGAPGTTSVTPNVPGVLDEKGWMPTRGGDGTPGSIAQGGGGGGAISLYAGGGGGCGGCPSTGGTGGSGGGGSIAIASRSSGIVLVETIIETAQGGAGGKGGAAPAGQTGGAGQGNVFGNGCQGGRGGRGGKGGDGAGGAGGVSVGVLYVGAPPVIDAVTDVAFKIGAPGIAGGGPVSGPSGVGAKTLQVM